MDAKLGIQLNPGFGDYKLPGCAEMPELVAIIDDEDKREAVIGVGDPQSFLQSGRWLTPSSMPAAVRVHDLPLTPDKILMARPMGGQPHESV